MNEDGSSVVSSNRPRSISRLQPTLRKQPSFHSTTPATAFQEIERGNCLEFAWFSFDNSFVIKTPIGQQTIHVADKGKRSSLGSFFSGKQEKTSKKILFNELLYKRIDNSSQKVENMIFSSFEVTNPETIGDLTDSGAKSLTVSLDIRSISDVFSGILLGVNYDIASSSDSKGSVASSSVLTNPDDIPVVDPKLSHLFHRYCQFFVFDNDKGRFLPVGPIMKAIASLKWDYSSSLCAIQYFDGSLHVVKSISDDEGKLSLITVASLNNSGFYNIISNNTYQHYHWWNGLLFLRSLGKNKESLLDFTVYSFYPSNNQVSLNDTGFSSARGYSYQTMNLNFDLKNKFDWKWINNLYFSDFIGLSNGKFVFYCR
jgi:hypothetical protein